MPSQGCGRESISAVPKITPWGYEELKAPAGLLGCPPKRKQLAEGGGVTPDRAPHAWDSSGRKVR